MSTGLSRTVRWFGTRVPLISRGVLSILAVCVALPLSGIVYNLVGITMFTTGWYVPILLILPVGSVSYIVLLLLLQVRYKEKFAYGTISHKNYLHYSKDTQIQLWDYIQ